jgi:hypothetical protein
LDPLASALFNDAERIAADSERLADERDRNREALRSLERAGKLTPELVEKSRSYYPVRKPRGRHVKKGA